MKSIDETIRETVEEYDRRTIAEGKQIMEYFPMAGPLAGLADRVPQIHDAETASKAIDDMELLESMLNHAHEYGEYARQFCVLEAKMFIRIANLGMKSRELRLKKRDENLIFWIKQKKADEIAKIMSDCGRGIRIAEVRRNEMCIERKMNQDAEYQRCVNKMLTEFIDEGRTEISVERFYREYKGGRKVDPKTADAWVGKARIEVRKHGGIGLGDRKGTYISTRIDTIDGIEEAKSAVTTRLQGIYDDLERVGEICEEMGFGVPMQPLATIKSIVESMMGT